MGAASSLQRFLRRAAPRAGQACDMGDEGDVQVDQIAQAPYQQRGNDGSQAKSVKPTEERKRETARHGDERHIEGEFCRSRKVFP